jgi:peptidyl-prolyl cis-trans isomerase B (cyclophilin B)
MPQVAPKHVAQIEALAKKGAYDNVAFHRVIDGFMAQTGDVQYGNMEKGFNAQRAGTGGSDMADIPAEFSKTPFTRGVVGKVVSGMEAVDKIKRGAGGNGEVSNPDRMIKVTVGKK